MDKDSSDEKKGNNRDESLDADNDFNVIKRFIDNIMLKSGSIFNFISDPSILEQLDKEGTINFGYSFSIDSNGNPKVKTWGNTLPNLFDRPSIINKPISFKPQTKNKSTFIEPFTDVIEDSSENIIRIIVELPGINKSDINLVSNKNILKIKAKSERKNYKKVIKLPEFYESSVKARYNQGTLEIIVKPKQSLSKADEGFPINID